MTTTTKTTAANAKYTTHTFATIALRDAAVLAHVGGRRVVGADGTVYFHVCSFGRKSATVYAVAF